MTFKGIICAVTPLLLFFLWSFAYAADAAPVRPPDWLWELAMAALVAGSGVTAHGLNRRDIARGGDFEANTPAEPQSTTLED
jgi:hypothetical protein|tara:strand:+ start:393 stop:638 length:246 start_codon:yes stop_codon:yes gene_type:complete